MPPNTKSFKIIILNWNSSHEVIENIQFLLKFDWIDKSNILVVDNNSVSNDYLNLKSNLNFVEILRNEDNFGYAGGNNIGLHHVFNHGADVAIILNADTKLNNNLNAQKEILDLLSEQDTVDKVIGLRFKSDEIISPFYQQLNKFIGIDPNFKYVTGCALIISKEIFLKTNGFDNDFFMYVEEIDFCYRVKKLGFDVYETKNICAIRNIDDKSTKGYVWYYQARNMGYFLSRQLNGRKLFFLLLYVGYVLNFILSNLKKQIKLRNFIVGVYSYMRGDKGIIKK
jgi:GT2 family glycosyltransferase